jgi:cyanophycinase-like exopeptidase
MRGPIALHGGGEFLPGDEAFLNALLDLVPPASRQALKIAIVPTAAARGRSELAGAHGVTAFERVGRASGRMVAAEVMPVVDKVSARDRVIATCLEGADIVHFPGGDPDLIPSILPDTPAWEAIVAMLERGGVLAGASAGAMALAGWTWTPAGGTTGLGLIPNVVVVPHADAGSWERNRQRFGGAVPNGFSGLGIGERTGVIVPAVGPWRVVGEGEARWLPGGQAEALVVRDGETFEPSGGLP